MFRRHLIAFSTWSPLTPFLAPPDGAGGGGAPAAGGSDAAAGDGGADDHTSVGDGGPDDDGAGDPGDRGDGDRGQADDHDDDPDNDDREFDALPPDQQAKTARTRLRRYQRQFKTLRPIADMFRGPDGRLMPTQDVQRRLAAAADWEEMNEFLQQHPDIVGQILERKNRGGRGPAEPQRKEFEDPFADESKLPFDTTTDAGKFIVNHLRNHAKENFELRQLVDELRNGVTDVRRRDSQRSLQQTEGEWKNRTLEAARAAGLDKADLQLFVESVWNVFERGKLTRSLNRLNLQDVIAKKLAPFKARRRSNVAGQQQRAEHGRTVPPPAGRGRTTAATPNDKNNVGTIKDARKSLFTRLGMSAGPR